MAASGGPIRRGTRAWPRRSTARGLAAAACLLPAVVAGLAAQELRPLSPPPAFSIDQWTTEDGLPQNSVNAVLQGPAGYLWLGTFGGLIRFDGTRFTLTGRADSTGRRHLDRILTLAVGPDGSLWIGTQDAGLLRRRDGEFDVFTAADGLPDDHVASVGVTGTGRTWVVTGRGHVSRFADGRFETLREVAGAPVGPVAALVADGNGRLLTRDGDRLLVLGDGAPSAVSLDDGRIAAGQPLVFVDRAGGLWFERSDDMARLFRGTVRVHDVPDASFMAEDPRGGFWLGASDDGLLHYRPDAGEDAVRRHALPDGSRTYRVRAAHVDRAGNVWFGTNANGLLRARPNLFATYTTEQGLSHDVATALYEDTAGVVWAATNCGGVNAIDLRRRTVRVFNPPASGDPRGDPCVFALTQGPGGAVWQGSYGNGVSRLTGGDDGGAPPRRVEGLPDSVVLALFTDRDGSMWVGTGSGGVSVVEDGRVRTTYTSADGLSDDAVRFVRRTRGGELWVGTLEGANRFSGGRFTDTVADGLHVRAIHEDGDGNLWIGTYGAGLVLHRDGESTHVGRDDGLADDVVSAILEDDAGNLWMSGNRGVYRVARGQLIAFAEGRRRHVHSVLYGADDGLHKAETNGGFQPAALRDSRGRMWFPTVEGVAVVDPVEAAVDAPPPPVTVEEVFVDGAPRAAGDTVVVGPGRPNVEFHYSALSLSGPEHVTFRHRLEGFDESWVQAGTRRVAYYPRLAPGEYRFVVSAANRSGTWGATASHVALRVIPPVWSRWWFRLGAAAGLLGLVAAVVSRRELAARRERDAREDFSRRLIESQEHERKRVAGALHDGLGQQLLVVRNRALVALRAEETDPSVRDQLVQIKEVVTDSLASVRSLARNLTPHQLQHLGLTSALEAMIESIAEAAEISVEVTIDEIDGLLSEEGEINLYRVVQEALNNVARHSGAATAAVRVRHHGGAIRVTVADDGRGFDPDGPASEGFGLSGMAERVRILGGDLDVRASPGRGTRIGVSVPVGASDPEARS